ncbi:MAG: hypothetical protein H0Z40_11995 [Desulfotomaculum sp.]|nr:hypothetical protein [Desulfotomaculum sp.]
MEWRGLRVKIIMAAFMCGLLIFFGGQILYDKYNIEKPLKEITENNKNIKDIVIEKKDKVLLLSVEMQKNNSEFIELYYDVYRQAERVLGNKEFVVRFKDNPDKQLKEIWRESQYYVHQAIMQGNFPEMVNAIENTAQEQGVDASVYVDHDNVYLELRKENGCNLIRVVPRENFMVTGKVSYTGGEVGAEGN